MLAGTAGSRMCGRETVGGSETAPIQGFRYPKRANRSRIKAYSVQQIGIRLSPQRALDFILAGGMIRRVTQEVVIRKIPQGRGSWCPQLNSINSLRRFSMLSKLLAAVLLTTAMSASASAGHFFHRSRTHYSYPSYSYHHVYVAPTYVAPTYVAPTYVAPVRIAPVAVYRPTYVVPTPVAYYGYYPSYGYGLRRGLCRYGY
jgi:hypothetical protein